MNAEKHFTPQSLSASGYVLALFEPADEVAILIRHRGTGRTVQRIATVETISGPQFQDWLRSESAAGADIFVGMNPIKNGANSRTKENIREIRHLYLDLDRGGENALEAIRNSPDVPAPNFTLRHTYSTLLHDLGTPVKVQQTLLGHSSAATTMDVYTHPVSESERDAVAKLGQVLFPTVPNLHHDAAGAETGRMLSQ